MISFFIPIRKNSKRIKNKNIKKIGRNKFGLTEIKLKQILKFIKLRSIDKVLKKEKFEFVISSDDQRVLNYVRKFDEIKVHKRSSKLSTDHSLDKLIKLVPKICNGNYILWTHVTSPFFNEMSYVKFIKKFLNKKRQFKSAFTANHIKTFIYNYDKKKWISHNYLKKKWPRTQDLDKIYAVNSAAFIAERNVYNKYQDRIDKRPLPIHISSRESFDVDDIDDFNKLTRSK